MFVSAGAAKDEVRVAIDQSGRDPGAAKRDDLLDRGSGKLGSTADPNDLAVGNGNRGIFDDPERIAARRKHGADIAVGKQTVPHGAGHRRLLGWQAMTSSWPNLSELMGRDEGAAIGWVGAPVKLGSVTPGRCDLAPAALRAVLRRIGRFDIEQGRELQCPIFDRGDLALKDLSIEAATPILTEAIAQSVLVHRLTLRSLEGGLGNGNPVRALREDGLAGSNVAQIGLAAFANSREMADDAASGGHLLLSAAQVRDRGMGRAMGAAFDHLAKAEAILLDCDIDVIDRSQFPGAPGGRAGGMAALDFFAAVRLAVANPRVRVVDLTEWDPPLDPSDISALTAGRWMAEVLSGFEARAD